MMPVVDRTSHWICRLLGRHSVIRFGSSNGIDETCACKRCKISWSEQMELSNV